MAVFDDGGQVRGGDEGRLQSMSASQPATFIFPSMDSYSSYQGEIVSGGTVVWQTTFDADQLPRQPESDLQQISFWISGGPSNPAGMKRVFSGQAAAEES